MAQTDVAPLPSQALGQPFVLLGNAPLQQKFGFLVAVAALIALLVGGWMWSQTPDYRVLYANLSDRDGGAVISSLQQMNVPYKFAEGGGALLVPAAQVHEVRLKLASQGLPRGGLAGFELMESQKLGTTQFQEQVNYQRALEGELARSVQAIGAVASARVHIAFSKPSVFVREQQKPSASVLVALHPGRSMDPGQVSAIVHLVASSVPDLPTRNVTVIDQSGNLLTTQGGAALGLDPTQLRYQHEVEQSFAKRIEAILLPIIGAGNVLAQVTADIDFSQSENIAEIYNPNPSASASVRSQQSSESSSSAGTVAGGVPGALSNQPPGNATAPLVAASGATSGAALGAPGGNTRRDSTVNYEVDKTIRHTRHATGALKRLSVAVVVNHRMQTDAAGKVTAKPLSADELTQVNALVKEVMGYNKDRGDTLNVTHSPFSQPERAKVEELPLWKQPDNIALAKEVGKNLLIAAVVLFVVLRVLRPALKRLSETPAAAGAMVSEAQQALAMQAAGAEGEASPDAPVTRVGYERNLEIARNLAREEPQLVASVVKEWVSGNE